MMAALYKGRSLGRQQAIFPALIIAAVVATLFSLIGIAGVTGHLPEFSIGDDAQACKTCGVVESIQQRKVDNGTTPPYVLWQTRVRLENGDIHTFYSRLAPAWQIGGRVRIENDQLIREPGA